MDRKWIDSKGIGHQVPEGVDVRKWKDGSETVSIRFRYNGEQCRELSLAASAATIKTAAAKLALVKSRIQLGQFNDADYLAEFPESKRARSFRSAQGSKKTVAEWCKSWVLTRKGIKPSSILEYSRKLETYWVKNLGSKLLHEVTDTDILAVLQPLDVTRQTLRGIINPFRMALDSAKLYKEIERNPFRDIELRLIVSEKRESEDDIDPFTWDERTKLVQAAAKLYPTVCNMVETWLWTGLRTCEIIALTWEDIDLKRGIINIRHMIDSAGNDVEGAKTGHGVREVVILPPAKQALLAQKAFTFIAPAGEPRYVFRNPAKGERWSESSAPSAGFWQNVCHEARVRYRRIYQCRHTFATTMLDRGEDARWIARQLGHKDVTMLFKTYGRERVLDPKSAHGYELRNKNFGGAA